MPDNEQLHSQIYELHCKEFREIKDAIQSLERCIKGSNGTVGMSTVVDRHEQWIKAAKKVLWCVTGTLVTIIAFWIKDKWF